MIKRLGILLGCALLGLGAGAAGKEDPVAAAYPDWTGLTSKNRITGRDISPSDLRHKVTIVMEFEAGKDLQSQLIEASSLAQLGTYREGFGSNWEDLVLPRDVITLVIIHNAKTHESVQEAIKPPKGDQTKAAALMTYGSSSGSPLNDSGASVYENVTYTGAPDSTGKLPYVYVLSPSGRTVLMEGALNAEGRRKAHGAVAKGKKEIAAWEAPWTPFIGNTTMEKANPAVVKALEKGRSGKMSPMEPIAKTLLKNIMSKDEAVAREAQIQYDAIYQARGELVHRILLEVKCPHRASYDIGELLKYFPREKKRVEGVTAKIMSKPEYVQMAKTFSKLMVYADPSYTCKSASEAKKAVAELTKLKKKLVTMKESQDLTAQNGALILDMKLDEIIPMLESQASAK